MMYGTLCLYGAILVWDVEVLTPHCGAAEKCPPTRAPLAMSLHPHNFLQLPKPTRVARNNWLTSADTTREGQQRLSIDAPHALHEASDSQELVPKETRSGVTPGR